MNKIFVSDRASLGDTLLATPTLRAIKETYPDSRTILLASPATRDIVEGHPLVDEVLFYEKGDSIIPIIRKIWRADLALILDFHYRSSFFAWLARIPLRIGRADKAKSFLTHQVMGTPSPERYEAENTLQVARYVGINTNDLSLLMTAPSVGEQTRVRELLAAAGMAVHEPFVVIAPYSLAELKDWPAAYYQEVIDYLAARKIKVIAVGGKEHRLQADGFLHLINFVGLTNIRETTYLVSLARTVLCGCTSSVLHFASTTSTPLIALYGPTSPQQWAPRSRCHVLSRKFPCSPCYNTGRACLAEKRCLTEIRPDEVCAVINDILTG